MMTEIAPTVFSLSHHNFIKIDSKVIDFLLDELKFVLQTTECI